MLNERARDAYSIQNYGGAKQIEGVEIVQLRRFNDDGGSMTELGRLSDGVHRDGEDLGTRDSAEFIAEFRVGAAEGVDRRDGVGSPLDGGDSDLLQAVDAGIQLDDDGLHGGGTYGARNRS